MELNHIGTRHGVQYPSSSNLTQVSQSSFHQHMLHTAKLT